ncbi:MAG: TIGR02300 family protein [Pseudomonadota bacterium]
MAKAELGTKRVCPETGKKFYDLDKNPIVSPYTGNEYPISFFEGEATVAAPKPEVKEAEPAKAKETEEAETDDDTDVVTEEDGAEIVSLEDVEEASDDDDDDDDEDNIPDIPDIPDVEIDDDDDSSDDDTFLEDDDEDDDLSDVIVSHDGKDEES